MIRLPIHYQERHVLAQPSLRTFSLTTRHSTSRQSRFTLSWQLLWASHQQLQSKSRKGWSSWQKWKPSHEKPLGLQSEPPLLMTLQHKPGSTHRRSVKKPVSPATLLYLTKSANP